ncbi:hypothetical protein [Actinokineospora sp. HUAS TT18]|uniref:hypothetical protein n=1 Tax=Actinokineospora sp. HUAS TT18 TaxID=3447451 RepID=UPI003F525268
MVDRLAAYTATEHLTPGDLLFAATSRRSTHPPETTSDAEPPNRENRHGTLTMYSGHQCRCQDRRGAYATYRATRRDNGLDRPPIRPAANTNRHVSRYWFRQRIWKTGTSRRRDHPTRPCPRPPPRPRIMALAGGADLQTVRERLGHASLRATERYLHTIPTQRDQALDGLERIRPTTPTSPHQSAIDRRQLRQPGQMTVKRSRRFPATTRHNPATPAANRTVTRRSRGLGNAERPFDVNHRKAV